MLLHRIGPIILVIAVHGFVIFVAQRWFASTSFDRKPEVQEVVVQLIASANTEMQRQATALPKAVAMPIERKISPSKNAVPAKTVPLSNHNIVDTTPDVPTSSSAVADVPATDTNAEVSTKEPAPEYHQPSFSVAYLNNPPPVYPTASRRLQESGKVLLRVYVDVRGTAVQVELRNSSGSPRLDQAAVEAVRKWKFIPAKLGKAAVAAWVLVPIIFQLDS